MEETNPIANLKLLKEIEELKTRNAELEQKVVKRKKIENELREQSDTIRSIVDASHDWIWAIDMKGNHTYSNYAVERILGYTNTELIGSARVDLMHPDDRQEVMDDFTRWIADNNGWKDQVLRWRHKNGSWRFLESSATPIIDAEGIHQGFRGVDRDITERRLTELELKRSEGRFKQLFESLGDAVYVTKIGGDNTGQILEVNPAAIRQTGYSREELLDMNIIHDLYIPGSSKIDFNEWDQRLMKGASVTTTEKKRHKNGKEFWTEVIVTPIEFMGEKAGLSINHDITKRKKTQESILENEEKFRKLYTTSNDAILLLKDFKLVSCNPKTLELFGCSEELIIGYNLANLSPEYQPNGESSNQQLIQKINASLTGTPQSYEWVHKKKNGEVFYTETTLNKMTLSSGLHIQAIIRDITERKYAEEEIQKYQVHLEELVQERTAEIEDRNNDLERYNKLFEGREFRIKELRDRVKELERELLVTH